MFNFIPFGIVLQMYSILGKWVTPSLMDPPAVHHSGLQESAPAPAPAQTGNRKQEAGATVRKCSISMTIAHRVERKEERLRNVGFIL